MSKNGLVSVIIPTHNRLEYLKKCIDSILAQTYQNFELIIIDNDSTDGTGEFISTLKDDNRISYFRIDKLESLPKLRNIGILKAKGDLICPMDSDDFWLPQKLETQVHILERNPEVGFTICNAVIYKSGEVMQDNFYRKLPKEFLDQPMSLLKELLKSNWKPLIQATMFRKACLQKTGLYDESQYADFHFVTKLCTHYKGILAKDLHLGLNRHAGNMTAKFEDRASFEVIESINYANQNEKLTKKEYKEYSYNMLYTLGILYNKTKLNKKARSTFLMAAEHKLTFKVCARLLKTLVSI